MRTRIDMKYALGLELEDQGFDFSVLSEFRARLVAGGAEQRLFEALLTHAKTRGWLKARGRQRDFLHSCTGRYSGLEPPGMCGGDAATCAQCAGDRRTDVAASLGPE